MYTYDSSVPVLINCNTVVPSIISGHADLVYAVPLLLVSLVLTFAGAFLTLDRTRSFASKQSDEEAVVGISPSSTKSKLFSWWVFEGGVGGLCGAWAFAGTTFIHAFF